MIVTYEENSWLIGDLFFILPTRGPYQLHREISSQLIRGLPLCLGPTREFFHDTVLYCGFG